MKQTPSRYSSSNSLLSSLLSLLLSSLKVCMTLPGCKNPRLICIENFPWIWKYYFPECVFWEFFFIRHPPPPPPAGVLRKTELRLLIWFGRIGLLFLRILYGVKKSAFESGVGWGVKIEEMGVLDFRVEGGKLRCRMSCGGRKWCWRIFFLQRVFERVFLC